mmetsp:Transcript_11343/g.18463  ORF Transcript_11343/g.18463 Transcript_11343/m.18463 type:complete len:356 (-) Transcript_11343:65-1132(-)
MLTTAIIFAVVSSLTLLLVQNIVVFDLLGTGHPSLLSLRPEQVVDDVQKTCRLVSGWRAMDSIRENSVYHHKDPLAIHFAGESMMSTLSAEAVDVFRTPAEYNELHCVTLRQLAIDNRIAESCAPSHSGGQQMRSPIRQVVVIGAGMDARPYRLHLPEVHWIEVDMPEVVSLKELVLADLPESSKALQVQKCTRIAFNIQQSSDLSAELSAVLARNGHDVNAPTLFLLEGLVMYLSPADIRTLMDSLLPVAAPQSRVVMSQVSFKYHYLLTNPIVVSIIELVSNSKSHKVASLFKSNLYSMDLGPAWWVRGSRNVGEEMLTEYNMTQWQPKFHSAGTSPRVVGTAENILDVELID